jgi:hypothetical protein
MNSFTRGDIFNCHKTVGVSLSSSTRHASNIASQRCIFITNASQQNACQRSIAGEVKISDASEAFFGLNRGQKAGFIAADSLARSLLNTFSA